jgi:hypothetical protein
MKKIYIVGALAVLFSACKPSVHINTNATPGKANFTNYMAIGNSLTSGYSDNSLYLSGQLNSYPERLFEQFELVGCKGPFVQPLLTSDEGYPSAKYVLGTTYTSCTGDSSLGPVLYPGFTLNPSDEVYTPSPNNPVGQINNIGVPGIRVVDYDVAGYGNPALPAGLFNPYAARFYNNVAGSPMDELIYRVHNLHPTFITFWLGANDVLGFASSGGVGNGTGTAVPIFGSLYSPDDISPVSVFEKLYDSALNQAISTGGVTGALINIPNITTIPFFNTVPAKGLVLTRQGQADSLNAAYGNSPNFTFSVGANYFIVQAHDGSIKQAVPGELVLLTVPQDSLSCAGWGSITPIPNQYVITTEELQDINTAIATFNAYIQSEAVKYNLAYVDMYSYLGTISSGITFNGVKYNAQYVTGGAFSLDGVHLTQRGYAIVANKILTDVNAFYGATIPMIDVNQYKGVTFP